MHDRKGLSSRCPARRPLLTGGSLMRSDSFHNRHQWPLKRSLISQEAPNLTVPRVVSLLLRHVSAVLDAVFGRFHRLSSFPNLRLNLRPAEVRPFPPSSAMFLGHVMHPHSKRLLRGLMSLRRRSHGPADVMPQVWRCHCSPERHHSEKCSLVTSCREAIYPHSSYEITTLAALLPNSNSCTPPILHERGREKERPWPPASLRRATGERPVAPRIRAQSYEGSYFQFHLFTLSCDCCESTTRSKSQGSERVGAGIETPVGKAASAPCLRAAPAGACGNPVQRDRPGPGALRRRHRPGGGLPDDLLQ